MIRSQLNSYSGSDPIWGFVALVGTERFSGEAAVGLDPRIRLFAVDGRVYFAEREGDAPIGALLVDSGVLSAAQLEQGTVRVGDTTSLARLFQRDPSVDRDAVELTIESATESLLASVANKAVGMPEVFPLRHHSSGVHHWLRAATVASAPPTLPEEPIAEAPVAESPVVEEPVVEVPAVESPVAEAPVVEAPVAEAPVAEVVVEEPIVEEPVVEHIAEEPVVEEAVAQWTVAETQIVEPEPVVEHIVEEPVVEEPVVEHIAEEPVVEEPVVEHIAEEPVAAEMPTIEMPVTEEPIVETPAAQSPWHSLVPLVESEPQVNGFAHASGDHHEPDAVEPAAVDAVEEHAVEEHVVEEPAVEEHVVEEPAVEEHGEPAAPALLSSLLWLTPAAADAAAHDAPEVEAHSEMEHEAVTVADEPVATEPEPEPEPELATPASALLTLPSFSSLHASEPTPVVVDETPAVEDAVVQDAVTEEPVVEEPVAAEMPTEVPSMPTLSSFTTLAPSVPAAEPTPVLTTDFFGALSDPTVDSPADQKLPGLPPLNAFEPGPLPAELPKLAAAPMSMDELVSQNAQTSAEAQSWSGATHNLAAVDIWEMVDEIVDDGHQTDEQLVGTGGAEKRSRGWLRGRKS